MSAKKRGESLTKLQEIYQRYTDDCNYHGMIYATGFESGLIKEIEN